MCQLKTTKFKPGNHINLTHSVPARVDLECHATLESSMVPHLDTIHARHCLTAVIGLVNFYCQQNYMSMLLNLKIKITYHWTLDVYFG